MTGALTASVVIPTYQRPDYLRNCLASLTRQTCAPQHIVVVDASSDTRTYDAVASFPGVRYARNPFGRGHTASSRNIGLHEVDTDIVAFVDDDAYPRADWLEELLRPYVDEAVGGVGGRISNGIPGEEISTGEPVGRFLSDGTLTGNFSVDTGADVEVDHFIGANMSFRRRALLDIGGIRDLYPGTCLREETDPALRIRQAGWKLVFTPRSCVDHVAGPYAKGKRFDRRYTYYAQRNQLVLVGSIFGARSPQFRGSLHNTGRSLGNDFRSVGQMLREVKSTSAASTARHVAGRFAHSAMTVAGAAAGVMRVGRLSDPADRSTTQ